MAETDKSLFKAILGPILPYFTEALVTGLSIPDDSHFTDTGLKMAVLKGKLIFFIDCVSKKAIFSLSKSTINKLKILKHALNSLFFLTN